LSELTYLLVTTEVIESTLHVDRPSGYTANGLESIPLTILDSNHIQVIIVVILIVMKVSGLQRCLIINYLRVAVETVFFRCTLNEI
jgi:hypothetical protein